MRQYEPITTVAIKPETAADFNKLKNKLNEQVPFRVTADVLIKILIKTFTKNGMP